MWRVKDPSATRPSVRRHPSWSWSSVDGPLGFQSYVTEVHRLTDTVEVLDCTFILKFDFAPYGQLKSVTFGMCGWLRRVVLDLDNMMASNDSRRIAYNVPFESANIRLDCVKAHTTQQSGHSQLTGPNLKRCLSLLSFVPKDSKKKGFPNRPQVVEGLILDICDSGAQRIGWFSRNRNQSGSPGYKHESMASYISLISGDQSTMMIV